jgi:hypothetical protein
MKRHPLRLGLLLIAGAIVNVAVAWGLSAYGPFDAYRTSNVKLDTATAAEWRLRLDSRGRNGRVDASELVATGFHFMRVVHRNEGESSTEAELKVGWPLLSMLVLMDRGSNGIPIDPRTLTTTQDEVSFVLGTRFLPLRPIWPGFAMNSIFYAAILWGLLLGPGMVKRTLRRRRGLCPACAYPTWGGGTSPVCTECGSCIRCPSLQPEGKV